MELTIKDNCLLCNKQFKDNEVIIWKVPENVWFCLECAGNFKDDNNYKWIHKWIVLHYIKWTILEYNNNNKWRII